MPIDSSQIPLTLDLFHLVLGALVLILLLLTVVLALLPFLAVRSRGRRTREAEGAGPASGEATEVPDPLPALADARSALQLLGLLQQEARLIDFLTEDIRPHTDAEIGAAVRVVHEGCRRVLDQYLVLRPILESPEGTSVTVEKGFNPGEIRLGGNLVGEPPFRGTVRHRGWRAARIQLPLLLEGHDPAVLAAAEVEL